MYESPMTVSKILYTVDGCSLDIEALDCSLPILLVNRALNRAVMLLTKAKTKQSDKQHKLAQSRQILLNIRYMNPIVFLIRNMRASSVQ